ncbi:hypothetical protein FOCC_FOCC017620, partial [Frankliniella occidentalis]
MEKLAINNGGKARQAEEPSLTQTDFRTYFWGSELVVAGRLLPGENQLSG